MGATKDNQPDDPARPQRKRLSPASQIGRMRSTGGTPEGRRPSGEISGDGEEWVSPQSEDSPVERIKSPDDDNA